MKKIFSVIILLIFITTLKASQPFISQTTTQQTVNQILKNTTASVDMVNRGVNLTASLWTATDGNQEDFVLRTFAKMQKKRSCCSIAYATILKPFWDTTIAFPSN